MFLKTIAHFWASSNLEREEVKTNLMIQRLEREKSAVHDRIQVKKENYLRMTEIYQKSRMRELNSYIEFMNEHISLVNEYLPEIKEFQSLQYKCIDSWFQLDLVLKKIKLANEKISTITSLIKTLEAYEKELSIFLQYSRRNKWTEFTTGRGLNCANEFVDKKLELLRNRQKVKGNDFELERKRIRSHCNSLKAKINSVYSERDKLVKDKGVILVLHNNNKKNLKEKFYLCKNCWDDIVKSFTLAQLNNIDNYETNRWIKDVSEKQSYRQIFKEIKSYADSDLEKSKDEENRYHQDFEDTKNDFLIFRKRVKSAHDNNDFTTFDDDKNNRDKLHKIKENSKADWLEYKRIRTEIGRARKILFDQCKRIESDIERIRPLHPDSVLDMLIEYLSKQSTNFERISLFGIRSIEQRREYWHKKNKESENAADV